MVDLQSRIGIFLSLYLFLTWRRVVLNSPPLAFLMALGGRDEHEGFCPSGIEA
jgi:hypothetical protein